MLKQRATRLVLTCAIAVASLGVALGLRLLVDPILGDREPFVTFYLAIALTAWFGGLRPALVLTVVVYFVADWFFITPRQDFALREPTPGDAVSAALYGLAGVLIAGLAESMHRAERKLTRSEARFKGLIGSATDAIIAIDADQKIVIFNAAAEAIFGHPASEMIGRTLDRLIPANLRGSHRGHVDAFGVSPTGGRRMGAGGARILVGLRQDGSEFPIEAQISQVSVHGETLSTVILRDITERVRTQDELAARRDAEQRGREEAEASNRTKDEFLAMLGHELRNPLAAVRNAITAASLDETRRSRALEIARRQAVQLGRLIDDLLDVARITQGRITLRSDRVSLAEVVERALESTRPFIQERGLELHVDLGSEPIQLEADALRLEQVFVNLLSNAGKYTDAGGRIDVTIERRGDGAVFRVRDTGIGIAPDMQSRLWDLFTQAHRSLDRAQGGLGIGLTLARRLVELHGGRIEARSEGIGKGSEFSVTLGALPITATGPRPSAPAAMPAQRTAQVLVVDDNPDMAESLTMLLELRGHRVRSVFDGVAALDEIRANVPDVMLVDIGLPGMDGYEVARRVRSNPDFGQVLLVALTGYGREEDKQHAIDVGFDLHLVKPVNPDALDGVFSRIGQKAAGA